MEKKRCQSVRYPGSADIDSLSRLIVSLFVISGSFALSRARSVFPLSRPALFLSVPCMSFQATNIVPPWIMKENKFKRQQIETADDWI